MIKVTYIDHCGSDLTTVNAARVSSGKRSDWEWLDEEGAQVLIRNNSEAVACLEVSTK